MAKKLTQRKVDRATDGSYSDELGLLLRVRNGKKRWSFRFTISGKTREMGLGTTQELNLGQARECVIELRKMVRKGIDPIEAKKLERRKNIQATEQTRQELDTNITFTSAAASFIRIHRHSWKNVKHTRQWISTLKTYACPVIGHMPVHEITTPHILKILEPIWNTKSETAKRVQSRIENIIDAASVRGHCGPYNPARWRGHLDKALPRPSKIKKTQHQPALPYEDVPEFMTRLVDKFAVKNNTSAKALAFLILTGTRTAEVRQASWDQFQLEEIEPNKWIWTWTIPADRTKTGKEHRVPLPDQAASLMKSLTLTRNDSPYLFPGKRSSLGYLSNMALLQCVRKMGHTKKGPRKHCVPHGFRSTFSDWGNEVSSAPHKVIEMALAHAIPNQAEAAYHRRKLFGKRITLMEEWANYLLPNHSDCLSPERALPLLTSPRLPINVHEPGLRPEP